MKPRLTVPSYLVDRYRCRDEQGGCGAEVGEQCVTMVRGKPTVPHADRWHQWRVDGSPGAWWNADGQSVAALARQVSVKLDEVKVLLGQLEQAVERDARR